jgi:hypothetical protein
MAGAISSARGAGRDAAFVRRFAVFPSWRGRVRPGDFPISGDVGDCPYKILIIKEDLMLDNGRADLEKPAPFLYKE